MKYILKFIVITLLILTSCAEDADDTLININGVWENVEEVDDQTNTLQLVFGEENTGFEINKTVADTGEVTSHTSNFSWHIAGNTVEVTGITTDTYLFNTSGQLVLDSDENVVLDKTSDDYSTYYE